VLTLVLLCFASAYGLVLAGGIALVWLIEVLQTSLFRSGFSRFVRDRRIWALALLLLVAIVNLLLILPAPDTYATSGIGPQRTAFPFGCCIPRW
jgi:Trk-type K+ transport system membrane component